MAFPGKHAASCRPGTRGEKICARFYPHAFSKFATLEFARNLRTGLHLGKRLRNFALIMPVGKPVAKFAKQKIVCFKFFDRFAYSELIKLQSCLHICIGFANVDFLGYAVNQNSAI